MPTTTSPPPLAAPKPSRRPIVRAFRFAAYVLLAVSIAYGALCWWYYSQEIKLTRNFAAELNAPILKVPEEQRAWTHYRRALEVLEPRQNGEWSDGIHDKNWPATAAYLKRNAEAIDMIRAAAKLRPLGILIQDGLDPVDTKWRVRHRDLHADNVAKTPAPSENPNLMNAAFTHLGVMIDLSNVLDHDALLAAQENDGPRVVANIEAMLDLGEQAFERQSFVSQMVATTMHGMAINRLAVLLAESPQTFTDADLIRIANRITGNLDRDGLRMRLQGEQAYVDDLIQRHFTDDGQGNGHFTIDGYPEEGTTESEPPTWRERWDRFRLPIWALFVVTTRQQFQADSDRYFAAAEPILALDSWAEVPTDFDDAPPHNAALAKWDKTWDSNLGIITHVRACNADIRQYLGANLIAIALIRFHREHNRWPTTLAEVPAELLAKTPLDQFNGQPLCYKLQDAAPLIYSVGPDCDDDNGTPPVLTDGATRNLFHTDKQPDGDQILWPPKQPEPEEEVDEVDEVEDVEMDAPDEESVEAETEMDANESIR